MPDEAETIIPELMEAAAPDEEDTVVPDTIVLENPNDQPSDPLDQLAETLDLQDVDGSDVAEQEETVRLDEDDDATREF